MEKAGEPIPGSKYVRAFCALCGEPMRVSAEVFRGGAPIRCESCSPPRSSPAYGTVIPVHALRVDEEEDAIADELCEEGEWDNAVRAVEDAT
jgi:hypothetical protein